MEPQQEKKRLRNTFTVATVFWFVLLFVMINTPVRDFIDTRFSQNLQFILREKLKLTPPLSEKIKMIAIDDATSSMLGSPFPRFDQWYRLIQNIARQNPKAILIDGLFSSAPGDSEAVLDAIKAMREQNYPVYTGAFLFPQRIKHRQEIGLESPLYDLFRYVDDPQNLAKTLPPLADRYQWRVYGPHADYSGAFAGQGHIVYEDVRRNTPLFRLREDRVFPHLSLFAADSWRFQNGDLMINGLQVPLDSKGRFYFNHRPAHHFKPRSFRFALQRADKGEVEKHVEPGDVVLIFTGFATGNTDIVDNAPFGAVPGGFFIATLIDSVLTHRWMRPVEWENSLATLLSLGGFWLGFSAAPLAFWLISIFCLASYFIFVTYLFAVHSIVMPWTLPMLGFVITGLIQFAYRSIQGEIDRLALQKDFFAEKSRRLEEENKKVVLEQSLALGRVVQDLLLPKQAVTHFGSFAFDTRYHPALVMGGDWIYIWEVSKDERRVFIGDVMGKGPSAAIPVAIIIGTLKDCENRNFTPHDTILKLNQRFVELFNGQITATLACITVHRGGRVELYNAGSPGWYLLGRAKSECLLLRSSPLGLSLEFKPAYQELQVEAEQVLFTFTDGYLEGSRALRRLMRDLEKIPPENRDSTTIHQTLIEAGEGSRQEDDMTLLAVKVA